MSESKIKMIASDVDGTLVKNIADKMPEGLFDCIRKITDEGGYFAVATGRQYTNMREVFAEVRDRIYFICENGCCTIFQDEVIDSCRMDRGREIELIEDIRAHEGCQVMISGVKTSYLFPDDPEFVDLLINKIKYKSTVINDISEFKEGFSKISMLAMHCEEVPEDLDRYFKEKYQEDYQVLAAGHGWLDIIPKDAGKGRALEKLMARLSVKPEELMVFGDNENDMSMFGLTEHSYAMVKSQEHVKKAASLITDSPVREMKQALKIAP